MSETRKQQKRTTLSRRRFLQGMAAAAGSLAVPQGLAMIKAAPGKQAPGEAIPPLVVTFVNQPEWIEFWRAQVQPFQDIGLELVLEPCEFATCIERMYDLKDYGNILSINWAGREERIDPHFFLYEMLHSSRIEGGGLNAEKYSNPEYDELADAQAREVDRERRQQLVWELQSIIERDRPLYVLVFQDIIHAYNSERWTGVVPRTGAGIASTSSAWTYVNIEPLTDQTELRVGWVDEPVTLNPVAHKGTVEHIAMLRFIYDTYVKLGPDLQVVPWAAESWDWVDDVTLDITLREGMKFHDGTPVTVEDVQFTFDYVKQWDFGIWQIVTDNVESVEILDDRRVRFHLPNPFPPFLENVLTYAVILPRHIWENVPEGVGVDVPDNWEPMEQGIGSGFLKFGYWNRGQEVYLEANPDHFSAPKVSGVHFITVPSLEGLLGRLETGEIDMVNQVINPFEAERLESLGHITAVRTPNHGFFMSNADLTVPPFDNVDFRIAVDHVLDRQLLLNDVFGGAGTLPRGGSPITPANEFWHNPNLSPMEFSVERAREILAAAGYTWDDQGRLHYPA